MGHILGILNKRVSMQFTCCATLGLITGIKAKKPLFIRYFMNHLASRNAKRASGHERSAAYGGHSAGGKLPTMGLRGIYLIS